MTTKHTFPTRLHLLITLVFVLFVTGCEKDDTQLFHGKTSKQSHRLEIGWDELLKQADIMVTITPRSHGYVARAQGRGIIPAGEYAGVRFVVRLEALYSGLGLETLEEGEAEVRIGHEQFESTMDPLLQSFCCGEGHLQVIEGEYVFTVFGQVIHSTADTPHNHLFAGLASTAKTMNMNIADQTGTVVIPAVPPHDPGIGLIEDIRANYVTVMGH
jgi:hypothetical protein